jgi:hypothetical protein
LSMLRCSARTNGGVLHMRPTLAADLVLNC